MTLQRDPRRPNPLSIPRRKTVPPLSPQSRPRPGFSEHLPNRGLADAAYHLDTGVLYAVARDETSCHLFKTHYKGRMHTTDAVVEEVKYRATSNNGPEQQLVKNAAADVLRRLIEPEAIEVDAALLTDEDDALFEQIARQLRELEERKIGHSAPPASVEKHVGEATAIVGCIRQRNSGSKVVFLTNDGGASIVAKARRVDSRHFGHALVELVCSGRLTPEKAWVAFDRANKVTSVPQSVAPSSVEHFTCDMADGVCGGCDRRSAALSSTA